MLKISRESEIGLINILIDHDIISGKDLPKIKKLSTEANKSQIDAVFELKLTDENKILDVLIKEQNLEIVDLSKIEVNDDIKSVLPSNYIKMNFIAPFKVEGKVLHIAIPDSSKLSLMRNLKAITKKNIELHAATVSQISSFVEKLLSESGNVTTESIRQENKQKTKTTLKYINTKKETQTTKQKTTTQNQRKTNKKKKTKKPTNTNKKSHQTNKNTNTKTNKENTKNKKNKENIKKESQKPKTKQ